jgi:peptidoglycan/LPS O-acetylase OafA/YrhL
LLASALDDHLARYGRLRFALLAAATLAGGGLLHDVVERPFLRWRDDRSWTIHSSTPAAGDCSRQCLLIVW